jgi:hypothetical protein
MAIDLQKGIDQIKRPAGKNTALFLRGGVVNFVLDALKALLNIKMTFLQSDGTSVLPPIKATVTYAMDGVTIRVPPLSAASGGNGMAQVFGGNGPPSASTLAAGNYVTGQNPSCYVDETNNIFYFCSKAGTASTSQWTKITTSSGVISYFTVVSDGGTFIQTTSGGLPGPNVNKPFLLARFYIIFAGSPEATRVPRPILSFLTMCRETPLRRSILAEHGRI